MCFGGGGGGGDAGFAQRAAEQEKNARVAESTTRINDAFAGFGDDYYGGVTKAYLDYYRPQFDDQSSQARRALVLASPTTASSAYARSAGLLETDIARQEAALQARAVDAATSKRADVEGSRMSLLSQAESGSGMSGAANSAASFADLQSRPPAYSPLGQLFSQFVSNEANAAMATRAGYNPQYKPILFSGNKGTGVVSTG